MTNESKQFMYGNEYRDALNGYMDKLDNDTRDQLLKDFIFEYMEKHMTNEQVHEFITTGEW